MAAAASRLTMNITIGLGSDAVSVRFVERPLPSCRCSLCHTPITVCWPRSQALRQYFVQRCSSESAAPTLKDPHRVADASTVLRWFRGLDCSQPAFSFLRQTVSAVSQWLARGEKMRHGALPLSWPTLDPFLRMFWPLRL